MKSKRVISFTIDPDLLARIDRFAATMAAPRSWALSTLIRAALPDEKDEAATASEEIS